MDNNNKKREVGYIPFSNKFCLSYSIKDGSAEYKFKITESRRNLINNYRTLLENLELSPNRIIENGKKGINTVVMDGIVESGGSLASFLYIITDWAKEIGRLDETLEYLKIIGIDASSAAHHSDLYTNSQFQFFDLTIVDLNTKNSTNIKIDSEKFCEPTILNSLSNKDNEGLFSNRIVAQYPIQNWNQPPLLSANNQSMNKFIETTISQNIEMNKANNQSRVCFEELNFNIKEHPSQITHQQQNPHTNNTKSNHGTRSGEIV